MPDDYYVSQYSGEEIDALLGKAGSSVQVACNPNLLDNWYFGNPINQRGAASVPSDAYGIDRWHGVYDIALTGLSFPRQQTYAIQNLEAYVKSALNGKTVTASIFYADHQIATGTGIYEESGNSYNFISDGAIQINKQTDGNILLFCQSAATILAVKLELGDRQTLAHKDASGNWVLNEIPDYGEQLRRCQRYYRRLYFSYLKFAHYASGVARVGIPINGMRTKPSCNIIGTPKCYAEDSWAIASLTLGLSVNARTTEMEAANIDIAILEGSGAISNKVVCNDLLVEVISDL